ncbi:hypothetical protein FRC08_005711 [Ceratobasidium sp. 394]|nr:hypothetical protein FRC08_005711 [Ceratobasidium sp. 394]KAG9096818.1 hypothetical protein FS749_007661 [Ceratobasidium sp. UAMH 11750]
MRVNKPREVGLAERGAEAVDAKEQLYKEMAPPVGGISEWANRGRGECDDDGVGGVCQASGVGRTECLGQKGKSGGFWIHPSRQNSSQATHQDRVTQSDWSASSQVVYQASSVVKLMVSEEYNCVGFPRCVFCTVS